MTYWCKPGTNNQVDETTLDTDYAEHLIGLWEFAPSDENADTGLADGIAQYGTFYCGADAEDGSLVLDGRNDRFDVKGKDSPFDLSQGTVQAQFTQYSHVGSSPDTIVSRGETCDAKWEGAFQIQVTKSGAVTAYHNDHGTEVSLSTADGFSSVGDDVRVAYSWDDDGMGTFVVENLTTGETYSEDFDSTGLTMDITDNDDESWTIGAEEYNDGAYNHYFNGEIGYVAVFDENILTGPVPDGVVDGTNDGEDMVLGYTDADGDQITDGADVIYGNDGDDTIDGAGGDDTIYGGAGDDTLQGSGGTNTLYGGDGDDTFIGGAGADTFNGGAGQDNIDYSASDAAVNVDLSTSILSGGDAENDTIAGGIDGVIGSEYDDTLTGFDHEGTSPSDTYTNEFFGMGGDDTISGAGGDDYLDGGDGNDTINGGDGDDVIIGGPTGLPDRGYGSTGEDGDPDNDKDTLYGGAGNDTIYGGDDADYIDGGADDDYLDGGLDDDTILGGSGDDTIIGGEGSDTIHGGDGDDTIYGGLHPAYPDSLNIPDDEGDLEPENGQDVIYGGAGNDTIYGQDDDDLIYGGDGNDFIDGGIDDDTLYAGAGTDHLEGGAGSDTLHGGGENDVLSGGDDNDFIIIDEIGTPSGGYNTTVHGGSGGLDWDTLDLSYMLANGWTITHTVQNDDSDGNGFDGQVTLYNASTDTYANINYTNIEEIIPCFTPGTLIATPQGERAVETLKVGDKVITRDNGMQVIRWVGQKSMTAEEMTSRMELAPVRIRKGALGLGLPERDMIVSPNHRMLMVSEKAALLFEEHEVLVAAKHLVGREGIERVGATDVTYVHIMFDRHEVVLSDGTWSESFQPGDYTLSGIGEESREEIFALFPELRDEEAREGFVTARRILRKHEAALLAE
ncbi:Hint domain-containing protein [Celeribacter sp.]|uniref:Hint domain-containing protein n=1 Tax=Celeribacter sp. TaxID=1890673 RepID=UPI003A8C90B4